MWKKRNLLDKIILISKIYHHRWW